MKLYIIKALRSLILSVFSALLFSGVLFSIDLLQPKTVSAQAVCSRVGQCVHNQKCTCSSNILKCLRDPSLITPTGGECGSAVIGAVDAPPAVAALNSQSGGEIGLVFFASRLIHFANIVAGILVMLNFVIAGFLYVSGAGNTSNMGKINERMTWSVIGILVIISSYTLAGLFGLIFYGDATIILTPALVSIQGLI